MLHFRLSVAIYVVIAGTEKYDGEVAAISVIPDKDTTVSYMFVNKGNVHLRPKGLMKIYDDNDELVMNVVYAQQNPTLPGKPQIYTATVKDFTLPVGKYRAEIELQDGDWNTVYPVQKKKFEVREGGQSGLK